MEEVLLVLVAREREREGRDSLRGWIMGTGWRTFVGMVVGRLEVEVDGRDTGGERWLSGTERRAGM